MITIRRYRESDAGLVGVLIAETYTRFNLGSASGDELGLLLGPFRHARSRQPAHREAIARVIAAPTVLVAEDGVEVVGVLRGRPGRLASLFVRGDLHRRGIGRRLVEEFERESTRNGVRAIGLASSIYAVPFYTALGYRKTTGVRVGTSFDGHGLEYQPMKKTLRAVS